jgi:hypothetical protein
MRFDIAAALWPAAEHRRSTHGMQPRHPGDAEAHVSPVMVSSRATRRTVARRSSQAVGMSNTSIERIASIRNRALEGHWGLPVILNLMIITDRCRGFEVRLRYGPSERR